MMHFPRKARPFIALVAAYAVVLQTAMVAIGGAIAGGAGGTPICAHTNAGDTGPAPTGHGYDCLAACVACCCGVSGLPAAPGVARLARTFVRTAAPPNDAAPAARLAVTRAHRSRAPPAEA